MQKDMFDITKFNLIQDNEFYYLFRSLEDGDNYDIENGITTDSDGNCIKIRTDRERWEETSTESPKYNSNSSLSLEEVYDHIKMHYRRDTNCISFTSNANVAVSYGKVTFSDEYVMIKIPKKDFGAQVINAGEYMLAEIEKRINDCIAGLDKYDVKVQDILSRIQMLDEATSNEEIEKLISVKFTEKQAPKITTENQPPKIEYTPPTARISSWQALNEEQTLEKNRLIAKLTLLERSRLMSPIIPNTASNNLLIQTVGSAFSSLEQIHYGNIEQDRIINVQRELVYIFGLLQQVPEEVDGIEDLKQELITVLNSGQRIEIPQGNLEQYRLDENLSIDDLYKITQGKIAYGEVSNAIKKIFYLSKSQLYARELATSIRNIVNGNPKYERIIEYIENNSFNVDAEIVTRQSNKGHKISESVNLDINQREKFLVDEVRRLTDKELADILENSGNTNIKESILNGLEQNEKPASIEEYYAEAIVSSINWKEIGIAKFSATQKDEFIKKLVSQDSIGIYKKLQLAGVSNNDIPIYIMNMLTNANLKELINSENYVELISQNKAELEKKLSITQVETFLDFYKVEGTELIPREYQQETIDNIDRILADEKFAAAILPTGAGKSFIALIEMLKHKDEPILYLAPQDEILTQMKELILHYVIGKKDSLDIDADIAKVFPNLKFASYPGLNSKEGKELIKQKYGFIVLDEIHRTGANEWEKYVDKLLENQDENVKVLGITATPTRDVDLRNMVDETARKLGYSEDDIEKDKHIAKELDLQTAIQLGIVVNPRIISFIYKLNQDLIELSNRINELEDGNAKKTLQEEYSRIQKKYEQTRKYVSEAEGMSDILEENLKEGGRYIVFIPVGNNGEIEDEDGNKIGKQTGKDRIEEYKKKIAEEYLKDSKFTPKFFSMLGEYGEKRNREELKGFEKDDSTDVKFLIVMNKANEGLHIKGLDGMIWLRDIDENSLILMLQQLGRVIYSEDPNNPTKEEDRPIVIDASNNILKLLSEKNKGKLKRNDLALLTEVVSWSKRHNQIPDIDSSSRQEQIFAATLYRIQQQYRKYLDNPEELEKLTEDERIKIQKIIDKGSEVELWDIYLPPKEMEEIDAKAGIENFEVESFITDFVDLQKNITVQEDKGTFEKTLEVARILHKHGVDLSKINLTRFDGNKQRHILLKEIEQEGINIRNIIEQEGLDENFPWGQKVNRVRLIVRETVPSGISEDRKKEAIDLKLVPNNDRIAQILEIARILHNKYNVDLRKVHVTKNRNKKTINLLLKEIKLDGIDVREIIEQEGLDGDFEWGKNLEHLRAVIRGTKKVPIEEKQREEIINLGLIPDDKYIVARTLEVARILYKYGVDFSKIKLTKTVDGNTHDILLRDIKQDGINIEEIIRKEGLNANFPWGKNVSTVRNAARGTTKNPISDSEKKEAIKLGLVPNLKSIVAQTLEIAEVLRKYNVNFSKIPTEKNGRMLLLKDIRQKGIDIEQIIREEGLDPNYPWGESVRKIRKAYNANKKDSTVATEIRKKGTIRITDTEIKKVKEFGLIPEEEKTMVAQTLHISRILKANNVDLSKIQLSKKTKGKRHFFTLREIKQEGIDIEQIIKDNGLDGAFEFGRAVTCIRDVYNVRNKRNENTEKSANGQQTKESKKERKKGETGGYKVNDEELAEAFDLGLIPVKGKSVLTQTLDIARVLNANKVDLSQIQISRTINGKTVYLLLEEIEQDGVDIARIIKDNGLDGKFEFGHRVNALRYEYRNDAGEYAISDKEKEDAIKLGLIPQEQESAVAQTLKIAKVLKKYKIDLSKVQLSRTIDGKNRHILLKEMEIDQEGIDILKIIKEEGLDGDYPWGNRVNATRDAYSKLNSLNKDKTANKNGLKITPEEADEAKKLGLILEPQKSAVAQTIELAKILVQRNVDLKKINLTKRKDGKPVAILLKEIEQEGIDIEQIIREEGLDPEYPWGIRVRELRSAYQGNGTSQITDKEKEEAEMLGLISDKILKLNKAKKANEAAQVLNTAVKGKEEELDKVGTSHEEE